MVSSEDTLGNCCWPDQVWVASKKACVGTPRCPEGFERSSSGCVSSTGAPPPAAASVPAKPNIKLIWPDGSVPSDCRILVDQQESPCSSSGLSVARGKHVVRVERAGFEAFETQLLITGDSLKEIRVTSKAIPVQEITLVSEPPASVTIDGKAVGRTPLKVKLASGEHMARLDEPGFKPLEVALGAAGELPERRFFLSPAVAQVTVARPPGARVFFDGRELGAAPLSALLPVGEHRFRIEHNGRSREEVRVITDPMTPLEFDAPGPAPDDAGVPSPPRQLAAETRPASGPETQPRAEPDTRASRDVSAIGLEEALAILSGARVSLDEKRTAFERVATKRVDLTEFVNVVVPESLKDELCVKYSDRLRPVRYSARGFNSFGDPVTGDLLVNGVVYGSLPFDGQVPWCAKSIQVRDQAAHVVTRTDPKPLDPILANTDRFEFPGRKRRVSVSLVGDVLFAPWTTSYDYNLPRPAFGSALQLDLWGKIFHLALAFRVSNLMNRTLLRGDPAPTPGGDLFVGMTATAGDDRVMYRFTVDLGLSTFLFPAVRLVNTLTINEVFFVSLALQGSYMWPSFAPDTNGLTVLIGPQLSLGFGH